MAKDEPDGLREVGIDEFGEALRIDAKGNLHWKGKRLRVEQRITLRAFELGLATVVAVATAVQAFVAVWAYFPPR